MFENALILNNFLNEIYLNVQKLVDILLEQVMMEKKYLMN